MKPKSALLASAPSKDALSKLITQFYRGEIKTINDDGSISSPASGKTLSGVRVTQKGKRWRFEMERPS